MNSYSTEDAQTVYDSIEAEASQHYQAPNFFGISPRLIMVGLLSLGIAGVCLGSANIKIDPTVTFDTPLGQRTQPYWLVPEGAKVIKAQGSSGAVRGLGWGVSIASLGLLWHVGEVDKKWQKFIGRQLTDWTQTHFKKQNAIAELRAMAEVKEEKHNLELQHDINQAQRTGQFYQAIGYVPPPEQSEQFQHALPFGTPGTYAEIDDPSDKVGTSSDSQMKKKLSPTAKTTNKLPPLVDYPAVLLFGAPGAGKTTFLDKIVQQKKEAGHRVIILDPHYKKGAWEGFEVYGKAFDFEEIDEKLQWFMDEIKLRYERLATEDNPIFDPVSIVCDEFTIWATETKNAGAFLWRIVKDIRKINLFATLAGHTNTLQGLGGKAASGSSHLLIQALLELEVMVEQHPVTGRAIPAYQLAVKLPGKRRKDAFIVSYEPDTGHQEDSIDSDNKSVLLADVSDEDPLESGDVWGEKSKSEPSEPAPEKGSGRSQLIETIEQQEANSAANHGEPLQNQGLSDSEPKFINGKYTRTDAKLLVLNSLVHRNQKNTIETLWGCIKGSSEAYRVAKAEFDDLMSDEPETVA